MSKRQALRFFSFVILALLMVFGIGQFFRDKETTLSSLYSEPKHTVDTIIVGSSHVNSGVIPAVFWQEQGINAHNVFSWSQPIWISYYYIKEALRFQSPEVVVLDLYGMMYGNSSEQPVEIDKVNYRNSFSIDTSPVFWEMIRTVGTCGIDLKNPIDFLNPIRYHTGWKNISKSKFTKDPHKEYSYLKGFGVQSKVKPVARPDISAVVSPRAPYETAVAYLDKIVALAEKEQFSLVFTMLPYEFAPQERELFAWLAQYAAEREIPFLNYCEQDAERAGFDFSSNFSDATHANYHGATVLSSDLARFVAERYGPYQKEGHKNADMLDKDATKVYRVLEVNDAITTDAKAYFEYLSQDPNVTVYANIAEGVAMDPELEALLPLLQIEPDEHGIFKVENRKRTTFDKQHTEHQLKFANNGSNVTLAFREKAYFAPENKQLFCVYDQILERPTFYFFYDSVKGELVIKDFPAK